MADTEITDDRELDRIEGDARAWAEQLANETRRGPIGTMYVTPWQTLSLVAALRSERTQTRVVGSGGDIRVGVRSVLGAGNAELPADDLKETP